jgi:beta-lactamase regulating signal transducer with metallopeptidase domain
MSTIDYLLAQALGWTLVHSLWQGVLVGGAFLVARRTLHEKAARFRYALGCFALTIMIAASVLTFFRETNRMRAVSEVSPIGEASQTVAWGEAASKPIGEADSAGGLGWFHHFQLERAFPAMIGAWLMGVTLMSLRSLGGFWVVQKLRRTAIEWNDRLWQSKAKKFAREFGISRAVKLCHSTLAQTPAVLGYFKPILVIPVSVLTKLTPEQLEAVLWHELSHIKRNDYLVNLLQIACETIFFYHPVVWWISGNIRQEREHCCDDMVLNKGADSANYARALCLLEEFRMESVGVMQLAGTGGSLKIRVQRLLVRPRPDSRALGSIAAALVLLVAALFFASAWPRATAQVARPGSVLQFRLVRGENESAPAEKLPFANSPYKRNQPDLYVRREILLDGSHITEAKVVKDPINRAPQINVKLDAEGKERFAKITRENIDRQLAVVLEGKILTAPVIRDEIAGGQISITGSFTEEEATALAKKLQPVRKTGGVPRDQKPITFHAWFIETTRPADSLFRLGDKFITEKLDLFTFSPKESERILKEASSSAEARILQAPLVTAMSGKSVRLEMGAVADQHARSEKGPDKNKGGPVYSVNATGYVITQDAKNARLEKKKAPAETGVRLIGQSLEILPEIFEGKLSLSCWFQVSHPQPGLRNSGHFRVDLSDSRTVAVQQPDQSGKSDKYLFLMISPEVAE